MNSGVHVPKSYMTSDASARDFSMHYHTAILKPVVNIITRRIRRLTNLGRESRVSRTLSSSFRPSALICLGDTCPEHQPSCQCRDKNQEQPHLRQLLDQVQHSTTKTEAVRSTNTPSQQAYRLNMPYACQL